MLVWKQPPSVFDMTVMLQYFATFTNFVRAYSIQIKDCNNKTHWFMGVAPLSGCG